LKTDHSVIVTINLDLHTLTACFLLYLTAVCWLLVYSFDKLCWLWCNVLTACRFNSHLSNVLEPQHALSDTKMDSRVQSVYDQKCILCLSTAVEKKF